MTTLKLFFKFFGIGMLILSLLVGSIISIYYASTVHWTLAIGVVSVVCAIFIGIVCTAIYKCDLG